MTRNFNPLVPTSIGGATNLIYEPLYQANGVRLTEQPWLATSYSWFEGGKVLMLHLRKGVTWSDGKPFSAKDVAFTFNLEKKFAALNTAALPLAGAATKGGSVAVLSFTRPAYQDISAILATDIVPAHLWDSVANPVTYTDPNPVGTGPYLMKSFSPQVVVLVKNPHYWQKGLPAVDTVRWESFDSNSSVTAAYQTGRIDWSGVVLHGIKSVVARQSSVDKYWIVPQVMNVIVPNVTRYPLGLSAVRLAISEALDRPAISRLSGVTPPATSPTGLNPKTQAQYLAPRYKSLRFVPSSAKAKATLEAAGFHIGGKGIFVSPKGTPLALQLLIPGSYNNWVSATQGIVSELRSAGIGLKVVTASAPLYQSDMERGNFDLTIQITTPNGVFSPFQFFNDELNSGLSAPVGQVAAGDFGRYHSASVDKALAAYAASPGGATSRSALSALEGVMVNQAPVIPLFYNVQQGEYRTAHFKGWPTPTDPYSLPTPHGGATEVILLRLRPS